MNREKRCDVVVVGGRCAGAPLAMLLAARGHSVVLLERSRMPCDTLCTHWIRVPGVRLLEQWGLRERLEKTGCPPIRHVRLDFEGRVLAGMPTASDGDAITFAPRRAVLDQVLFDAAREAGAQVRDNAVVRDLLRDGEMVRGVRATTDCGELTVRARLVVGADGRNSTVARAAGAPPLEDRGVLARSTYAYWAGTADLGLRVRFRGRRGVSEWPTHDGLTMASLVFPPEGPRTAGRGGITAQYLDGIAEISDLDDRGAIRLSPVRTAAVRNLRRGAHGPGWVLVGDAGHHKDPVSAQGISDAFSDAMVLAEAVHRALRDEIPMDWALSRYVTARDAQRMAAFEYTCEQARLRPFDDTFFEQLQSAQATPEHTAEFLNGFVGSADDDSWLGAPHGLNE